MSATETSIGMCLPCPDCKLPPAGWRERPKFGSREIYFLGCKRHSHMGSGVTRGAAIMSWNRTVTTVVFNRQNAFELKRRIG